MNTNYTKGTTYEAFVRRAHKLQERNARKGAVSAYFSNLLDAEDGIKHSFLDSYQKQFEKVKGYLDKSFDAFIKNKRLTKEDVLTMKSLKDRLGRATSGVEMYNIIEEGIDATQPYKEF